MNVRKLAIPALALVLASCGYAATETGHEFKLEDGRSVYPAYRTWEFDVSDPGLYAIDIAPADARTRPQVREWLDGTQIAFSHGGNDYAAKADENGRIRRFRWLEAGRHTLDLYLHFHVYSWTDEMPKAMGEKGIRVRLERLSGGEVGFWMEGADPDCMARVMGEMLVVAACAAPQGNDGRARSPSAPQYTMEVLRASASPCEPIWSQTLAIGTTPVRFEYPCDREGAFKYLIKNERGEVVEGPWDFVVTDIGRKEQTDLLTPNGVRGTVSRVSDEQIRVLNKTAASSSRDPVLVDRVDCTEGAGGEHLFREGGKSEVVETSDGAYRLAGPRGFCFVWRRQGADGRWVPAEEGEKGAQRRSLHDWFGYTLKVDHPGRSHALVVRVPNDRRHFTSVVAYDRRTRLSNAWSIDSGDAPAAGPWSEMKIPLWPNSDAVDVMVLSTDGALNTHVPHPDRRGAVASLALLEYPDGFPPLEEPACGWSGTRDFGWDGEQINLGPNERTMPPLPDAAAALVQDPVKGAALWYNGPYHDWRDFMLTWERTFELEAWRGGTILLFPVYTYGMVTFQGRAQMIAPPGRDVYAEGCFGGEGERNPLDRDVFALMLQRAQKHGVKLVADFMIQRTYPYIAEAWARYCGMEGATNGFYLSATADGRPFQLRPIYHGLPNPAHPVARKIQVEFCRELGRRYGRYESFAGVNHRFWKHWPGSFEPWFHSADLGFDDFTVGEFSKATGLSFAPVGNDEKAFDARKKRICTEHFREWNAWRAEVCRSLHEEMLAALREGAPGARFYAGAWRDALSEDSGLSPAVFSGKREFGFGDERAKIRGPGVEINNLDPIHFGSFWLQKQNTPPPTGLCCNSSYRCSPYHLEPAALALAENKLNQLWAGGQWCLPPLDDALREFVRAYRAIPDRDDWRSATNGNAPVAVWWAKDGDDVLFWAVNRTDASRRVVLTFDKEPSALVDCVTGNPVNPVNPVKKTLCEIKLPPFMPGVFRAKGVSKVVSYEVPVDEAERQKICGDFEFVKSLAPLASNAVEVSQTSGETYYDPAGALGKRDRRWTFADLLEPMAAACAAEDWHSLRALVGDFRTNHRWWYEAFGWPEDFCVQRRVGRAPFVGFLRQTKRTEMWFGDTNGVYAASYAEQFPQAKEDFVCAPKGVAIDIFRHGPPGGHRQLELDALFGGGFGDIRVEDGKGNLIGIISHKDRKENVKLWNCGNMEICKYGNEARLETRVLSVPIPNPGHQTHVRLVGMGEKGLAIHRLGLAQLPSRPVREWQVIGPFDKGGGERDKESYAKKFAPELEPFDSSAEYEGMGGGKVRWKTVTLGSGERVFDVLAAVPHEISKMNGVAYLRTVIKAKRRQPTMLRYCNDYYGVIWLNGKLLVPAMRGPAQQYEAVEVWLEKGENVILVKTSPGSAGTWHFGAALNDDGSLEFK